MSYPNPFSWLASTIRHGCLGLWYSSALYPFKGICYFVARPDFYPLFRARLLPIFLLSAFVFAILFVFTYLPIVAFLEIFQNKSAWLNALFLILEIEAVIVTMMFEIFFVDETLVDVFDAVLINEGLSDLVAKKRVLDMEANGPVKALGKLTASAVFGPFSLRQILEYIIYAPLNFIPWIGVPLFLILTGYRAGPFYHWRYFQLLELTKSERKTWIKQRKVRYTWFGTVSLLLNLVPGLNMFFLLTCAAGSALWAAQIEKSRRARGAADQGAVDERYEDDPV